MNRHAIFSDCIRGKLFERALYPLDQPNMITHTFRACFDSVPLPAASVESSRFLVDKLRARELLGERYFVSHARPLP